MLRLRSFGPSLCLPLKMLMMKLVLPGTLGPYFISRFWLAMTSINPLALQPFGTFSVSVLTCNCLLGSSASAVAKFPAPQPLQPPCWQAKQQIKHRQSATNWLESAQTESRFFPTWGRSQTQMWSRSPDYARIQAHQTCSSRQSKISSQTLAWGFLWSAVKDPESKDMEDA